jgi:outer membrane protein assembly factor BamB
MLLAVLLFAITGFAADSESWPQFRGPASNPVASNPQLADRWSSTENVEWSTPIPGRGWSSPIVTNGKVFVTTAVTEGASKKPETGVTFTEQYAGELMKQGLNMKDTIERVVERDLEKPNEVVLHYFLYCLDLKSGKLDWKTEFYGGQPPGSRHRKNSFASETPVTDRDAVYVYVGNLGLYAFDLKGKQLWHTPLENNATNNFTDFGSGASPVLDGNQILIVYDGDKQQYAAAFDKRTGKQLWRTNRDIGPKGDMTMRSGWATPYVWANSIRTELVTAGPSTIISYDLEGKELWRMKGATAGPVPSPFAVDGILHVDGGRSGFLFAIKAGAAGDISLAKDATSNEYVLWSAAKVGTYIPTPVAYEGALYVLNENGILSRLDTKTGAVSYRSRLDKDAGSFSASPWAYNGRVFCLSEEGKTFVVAAGEKFELLHVNELADFSMASPAIAGDRLVVRTESKIFSIRKSKK